MVSWACRPGIRPPDAKPWRRPPTTAHTPPAPDHPATGAPVSPRPTGSLNRGAERSRRLSNQPPAAPDPDHGDLRGHRPGRPRSDGDSLSRPDTADAAGHQAGLPGGSDRGVEAAAPAHRIGAERGRGPRRRPLPGARTPGGKVAEELPGRRDPGRRRAGGPVADPGGADAGGGARRAGVPPGSAAQPGVRPRPRWDPAPGQAAGLRPVAAARRSRRLRGPPTLISIPGPGTAGGRGPDRRAGRSVCPGGHRVPPAVRRGSRFQATTPVPSTAWTRPWMRSSAGRWPGGPPSASPASWRLPPPCGRPGRASRSARSGRETGPRGAGHALNHVSGWRVSRSFHAPGRLEITPPWVPRKNPGKPRRIPGSSPDARPCRW